MKNIKSFLLVLITSAVTLSGQTVMPSSNKEYITSTASTDSTITIKAVGDVVPYSDFPAGKFSRTKDYASILDPATPYLSEGDVVLCNFEGPITKYGVCSKNMSPGKRVFAFRFPPGMTEGLLKHAGFNVLHIANNHAMDFGLTGLRDTVKYLTAAGIDNAGLKDQILCRNIRGVRVAVVGFNYFGGPFNDMHDINPAIRLVRQARTNADIVIVSLHAGAEGPEYMHVTGKEEIFLGEHRGNVRTFARLMIDSGADCVLGFSPHVLRGMEMYHKRVIAYSLGNFMGYGRALKSEGPRTWTVILELKLKKNGELSSGKIIPLMFAPDSLPRPDDGHKGGITLVKSLSEYDFPTSEMRISSEGELVKK